MKEKHDGLDFDNPGIVDTQGGEQVGFEPDLRLTFASLTGEDDTKRQTHAVFDAIDNRQGNFYLVFAQLDAGIAPPKQGGVADNRGDVINERFHLRRL